MRIRLLFIKSQCWPLLTFVITCPKLIELQRIVIIASENIDAFLILNIGFLLIFWATHKLFLYRDRDINTSFSVVVDGAMICHRSKKSYTICRERLPIVPKTWMRDNKRDRWRCHETDNHPFYTWTCMNESVSDRQWKVSLFIGVWEVADCAQISEWLWIGDFNKNLKRVKLLL